MLSRDKDAKPRHAQQWALLPKALEVRGQGTRAFYISGLLRRWLTAEANEVARTFGVDEVVIRARYTGRSYMTFD
jgi:hypothetical protein